MCLIYDKHQGGFFVVCFFNNVLQIQEGSKRGKEVSQIL